LTDISRGYGIFLRCFSSNGKMPNLLQVGFIRYRG